MASRALTSSTAALLLSLILFTNLLSSTSADCPYDECVVSSVCKAVTVGQSTVVGPVCCKLLEPLGLFDEADCICKGNQGANLQNIVQLIAISCNRPIMPLIYISCGPIWEPSSDRNVLSSSN
uniref:Bg70 protein n=1 Tax=Rhizophora mucronata TaxID=61149 RepID=A0A2P2L5C6_RHIMU